MKSSFLPGCAHMQARKARRFASFCQSSPGHLPEQRALAVHDLVVRERQHEVLAVGVEQRPKVSFVVVVGAGAPGRGRSTASVSCIQPMFHLKPKPSPPSWTGA